MEITKIQAIKVCKKIKADFIDFSFLACGAHNKNYLIQTKQGRLVLRIENNLQYKNLKREYEFLKKTNGKIGPKVYCFDDSKSIIKRDYIVEEFLDGSSPKRITDDFIIATAKQLKSLHRFTDKNVPEFAEKDNHYSLFRSFEAQGLNAYYKFRKALPITLRKEMDGVCERIVAIVKQNEETFFRLERFSLNHGDLFKENIFYGSGKVRFIDWEFVKYDLPQWDLASFIYFSRLDKKKEKIFLEAYGYGKKPADQKKLNLILLLHIFWMISWWVERLYLIENKKMDKQANSSNKNMILKEIKNNQLKLKQLIEIVK